jgi:hypothetical protein
MHPYQPLPQPPKIGPDEPALAYGLRLFSFVLTEDVTATLSDVQLELAQHAAVAVVAAREMAPVALERIQQTRRLLALVLTERARIHGYELEHGLSGEDLTDRPHAGPMAPLTPAPQQQPPSAGRAGLPFAELAPLASSDLF